MRTQKVLPPSEPLLERGEVPVRSTWWRFFHNLFGDVQDNQAMAIESLMPRGVDVSRQIGDIQQLLTLPTHKTGELERKVADLQTLVSLQGGSRMQELERRIADLQALVLSLTHSRSPLVQNAGAWIPADNSGASLSFTGVSAAYTQIGNMVFAYFTLTYPATADASAASIKGLPITVANANYAQMPCIVDTAATIANEVVVVPAKNALTAAFNTGNPLTAVVNSTLSGVAVSAMIIYPVS